MKKAASLVLILVALSALNYYGFVRGTIVNAIPEFFQVLGLISVGEADFPWFILSIGEALLSIGVILLAFAIFWVAVELAISKDKDFKFVITRTPVVFLAVGSGLYFGAQFAHAFAQLLYLNFTAVLIDSLFAIASIELTLTLLKYLKGDSDRFQLEVRLKAM
ncbi:MAG TPA: hypothetical protein VJI13_01225 [Candidatus Norongarragalinales archaeon]|nr:hypothetical protein [Candidatus Norongarragalinales archaeon]